MKYILLFIIFNYYSWELYKTGLNKTVNGAAASTATVAASESTKRKGDKTYGNVN